MEHGHFDERQRAIDRVDDPALDDLFAGRLHAPVAAPGSVRTIIQPFWPSLTYAAPRQAGWFLALKAAHLPANCNAMLLRQGLLRPPPRSGKPLASITVTNLRSFGLSRPGCAAKGWAVSAADHERAQAVATAIAEHRAGGDGFGPRPRFGANVRHVLASGHGDAAALAALLARHEAGAVAVLAPPGSALAAAAARAGCSVIPAGADPWPLLAHGVTLHGDEDHEIALLAEIAGLASGRSPAAAASHLIWGTRYIDPFSRRRIECEAFLDQLIEWRKHRDKTPEIGSMAGIAFWKQTRMQDFAGARPALVNDAAKAVRAAAAHGGAVAVWPSRAPAGLDAAADAAGVPVLRVEDGFIRSKGLGSDFIPPASIIIDRTGIYYDPSRPSDLETILQTHEFDTALLARARRLITRVVEQGVTKYNLPGRDGPMPQTFGRCRVLVPGQVADDRSVIAGGCGISPGTDLVARVRQAMPGAFIAYKPHPDVEAGHRRGRVPDADMLRHADWVVRDRSIGQLIDWADEVHTLTSLAGFEALLRGRRVTTYGLPFYAGWGLTTDNATLPRRTRRLTVEALAAATLILYPHYLDPVTLLPCGPEQLLDRLAAARPARSVLGTLRRTQGRLRKLVPQAIGAR